MTRIKICGLTRMEDIGYINEARPDYCGFIIEVPSSRRSISADRLRRLRADIAERIKVAGVFVNAPLELAAGLLNEKVIDMAQLHGQEDEAYIRRLKERTKSPVIKAFSVTGRRDVEKAVKCSADFILFDNSGGGTGQRFDWEILAGADRGSKPYFLAGGLNAENISEAVHRFRPWAVDLSSSVEMDGRKDREKILEAVAAVRGLQTEAAANVHIKKAF